MSQEKTTPPDALLLITPGCPHCATTLEGLTALVKEGAIGRLEVINVAVHPQAAQQLGVRTAPWTRLGEIDFDGALSVQELRTWATASPEERLRSYITEQLTHGQLPKVEALVTSVPEALLSVVPLLEDPESSMPLRLGIAALIEGSANSDALARLIPDLGRLSRHQDHRIRGDAVHFLSLTGRREAVEFIEERLQDENPEVREIAEESLTQIDIHQKE